MNNKNIEIKNIVKNSMEPVDDGGRKYNFIYVILGIIGGIIGLCLGGVGIVLTLPLGLGSGWLIKNEILKMKAWSFRDFTFKCYSVVPYPDLMNLIIPELTKMNMTIELNSDKGPMISHDGIIYDFNYNDDMTFSIWWRKTIGAAMLTANNIKKYRKISADMGIISYVIQNATKAYSDGQILGAMNQDINMQNQAANMTDIGTGTVNQGMEASDINRSVPNAQSEAYKFCHNCGTKYQVGTKFCQNCGAKLG